MLSSRQMSTAVAPCTRCAAAFKDSDPAVEKRTARTAETFGNFAEDYLERHAKAKKRSWKEDDRILKAELSAS